MEYNVREYGATGDGFTPDQKAIQAAIDECSHCGGGTVMIPAGKYRCGSIQMRSGICLYLQAGSVILASEEPGLFPVIAQTRNLPGQIRALIWADHIENASVAGSGEIDGNGYESLSGEEAASRKFRPAMLFFRDCRNIQFRNVSLKNSSFWSLHILRCERVMIQGITIRANPNRINTDGIDPDGCKDVIITDCNIRTGDDCIVIKSTEGDPCENITVSNCILRSGCTALKLGTESLGDIRNIIFSNCIVPDSNAGVSLYMKDGSCYENILVSNLVMQVRNEFPLLIDVTPRYYNKPVSGTIRNIHFENLTVTGKGRCYIEGARDNPIKNLSFRNITWNITAPCDGRHAKKPSGARRVETDPEGAINYAAHPYQFIAVNVDGLRLDDIGICYKSRDIGPDRGLFFGRGLERLRLNWAEMPPVPAGIEPVDAGTE